jgi:hypothetical protein
MGFENFTLSLKLLTHLTLQNLKVGNGCRINSNVAGLLLTDGVLDEPRGLLLGGGSEGPMFKKILVFNSKVDREYFLCLEGCLSNQFFALLPERQ